MIICDTCSTCVMCQIEGIKYDTCYITISRIRNWCRVDMRTLTDHTGYSINTLHSE